MTYHPALMSKPGFSLVPNTRDFILHQIIHVLLPIEINILIGFVYIATYSIFWAVSEMWHGVMRA